MPTAPMGFSSGHLGSRAMGQEASLKACDRFLKELRLSLTDLMDK